MIDQSRRAFFKSVIGAGAALASIGTASRPATAQAATANGIKGICLYVPRLGRAEEFVKMMNDNAPGNWTVYPLHGSLTDCYLQAKNLYQQAKEEANTFVGVVDPATFAIVHEAIADGGGSFHYITYEERNRVTFSAVL
jgi:hypothetical protein